MLNKISLPDPPPPSFPESDPHAKPPFSSPPPPPPLLLSRREMTPIGGSTPPAVESINRCLSEICTVPDESYSWENPRRFSSYLKRLQLIVHQFLRSSSSSSTDNFSPTVQTALKGISGDLSKSSETLLIYRKKSKIYVLINSQTLRESLQLHTVAIGGWLALLDSALVHNPDLHKKTIDLSREMKQAQFTVTENEERVYCTLQKEAEGRQTTKAVQSAIIMDLARALGTDSENLPELQEQIKLLRNDIAGSNSVAERRILMSLERIFNSWSTEPNIADQSFGLEFEEDSQIQPFKDFLCPLTKEVMKDPVVLESFRTYERTAIEYWFERCIEDGRDPTCPVTGQVLKSLEKKPNISLAGAIEEWVNRNVDIQINWDVECLSEDSPSVESMEHVFDNIYRISEDHPSSRYRIRNAGIVVLIVKILKNCSRSMGSLVRSKALMALLSLAKDEECKLKMLGEGMTRLAIHSLTGSSEKEREYAVKLLLEFSSDEAYCTNIASEKGALVLISSMAEDREYLALCNLAEEVLKKLEKLDGNVQHLAAAGRFEPLLGRLREGSDDVKIEMASMVGKMTLTNSSKEQIARQGAKILVDMLSMPEGRAPSLQALYNLSTLDDNATILIDLGLLMALANILFRNQDAPPSLRELAASTIANIVSKPGHWELACTNKEGVSMQSESVIHRLLGILSHSSPKSEVAVLQILHGIASSPQASESVMTHINSCSGIAIIIPYLEHPEVDHRVHAFKLTRILSERLGQVLASELRASNSVSISALKEKLLDTQCTDGERSDAACILANLPLGDDEVKTVLGTNLVSWIVITLKERHLRSNERASRLTLTMMDGLLGLLIHFVRFPQNEVFRDTVRENHLMTVFRDQLRVSTQPKVKQRAALGLKYLSETGRSLVASMDYEPQPPQGFFSSLIFSCGKPPHVPPTCPIHSAPCDEYSQFCLLKGNCIKFLLDLLNDEETSVQVSAVESLSTLLYDTSSSCFKRAVDELDRLGVNDAVISLLTEVRTGELQEKTIWFVERILKVDIHAQRHSMNQTLVRALVEAFKHGNANTKGHAQFALTNLKQISGVSGQNTNQARGR